MVGRSIFTLFVILSACTFWMPLDDARAEGNCPDGHYPTIDPGTGKQTGCAPVGAAEGPARQPALPPKLPSRLTIYWHPEASDVWAVLNHSDHYVADEEAFGACRLVMGDGCMQAIKGESIAVAIGRSPDGALFLGSAKSISKARSKLLDNCKKQSVTCAVIHEFAPQPSKRGYERVREYYFPNDAVTPPKKRLFSAVYWRNGTEATGQVFVATGKPYQRSAEVIAKEMMCRNVRGESGYCFGEFVGNVNVLLIFRDVRGEPGAVGGANQAEVVRMANDQCMARTKAKCSASILLDGREPSRRVVNTKTMEVRYVSSMPGKL